MGDLFLLSEAQMTRIARPLPPSYSVPRVDGRRVVSGFGYVIRSGLAVEGHSSGVWPRQDALQPPHSLVPLGSV
jgi:hypothetical protein